MKNIPHRDHKGRWIHYCMSKTGCDQWGSFGFDGGKSFFCAEHRSEGAEKKNVPRGTIEANEPASVQGRLF